MAISPSALAKSFSSTGTVSGFRWANIAQNASSGVLAYFCFISCIYAFLSRSATASYLSSHAFVIMQAPACSNPCSTLHTFLAFTSPEPVPPGTVCLAPFPNNAIFLPFNSIGKIPLFFNKTIPSAAILRLRLRFVISRWLISRLVVA